MDITSLLGRLAKLQSFFQGGLNVDENVHLSMQHIMLIDYQYFVA